MTRDMRDDGDELGCLIGIVVGIIFWAVVIFVMTVVAC